MDGGGAWCTGNSAVKTAAVLWLLELFLLLSSAHSLHSLIWSLQLDAQPQIKICCPFNHHAARRPMCLRFAESSGSWSERWAPSTSTSRRRMRKSATSSARALTLKSVLILVREGTCLHLLIYNALTFVKAPSHSRTLHNTSEYSLGLDLPWGDLWDDCSTHWTWRRQMYTKGCWQSLSAFCLWWTWP